MQSLLPSYMTDGFPFYPYKDLAYASRLKETGFPLRIYISNASSFSMRAL